MRFDLVVRSHQGVSHDQRPLVQERGDLLPVGFSNGDGIGDFKGGQASPIAGQDPQVSQSPRRGQTGNNRGEWEKILKKSAKTALFEEVFL